MILKMSFERAHRQAAAKAEAVLQAGKLCPPFLQSEKSRTAKNNDIDRYRIYYRININIFIYIYI